MALLGMKLFLGHAGKVFIMRKLMDAYHGEEMDDVGQVISFWALDFIPSYSALSGVRKGLDWYDRCKKGFP